MKNNQENSAAAGSGFLSLLTIAFIVLKLTGVISWSWTWVLAPIWIPAAIAGAIIVLILVAAVLKALK